MPSRLLTLFSGKDSWLAKNALLYDQFTTDASAPLTSPRTCEPGPGTVVVGDAGNEASISGGALVLASSGSYKGISANVALTRASGLGVFASQLTGDNVQAWWGFDDDTAPTNSLSGEYVSGGTTLELATGGSGTVDFSDVDAAPHIAGVVLRDTGCFFVWDGKLIWVDDVSVAGDRYPQISARICGSTYDWFWAGPVDSYSTAWAGDFTEVTDTETNPATGTAIDCDANCHVTGSFTCENTKYIYIYIRYTDADNWVRLSVDSSRVVKLEKNVATSTTTVATGSTLSDATAYNYDIVANGTTVTGFINKAQDVTGTISDHATVAQARAEHDLATNDLTVTTHPTPKLGIATSRIICPQDDDTATMTADAIVEFKNVTLPSAGSDQVRLRYTGGSNHDRLYFFDDGQLDYYTGDGTSVIINTGAGTVSNGDDVVAVLDGVNVELFVAGASVGSSASGQNTSATSLVVEDSLQGLTFDHIACFPRDLSSLLPSEMVP